jgi:hypothetical protein
MGEQRRPPVTLTRFNGNKRSAEPMELDHGKFSLFLYISKNPLESGQFCLAAYWSGRVWNISSGTRNMLPIRLEGFANCTATAEKNHQYNAAKSNIFITRGRFFYFFCDICNTASSDAPEIPLYVIMLGLNPCRQCCGSGMFIPYPGSDFFPSRIPDPN